MQQLARRVLLHWLAGGTLSALGERKAGPLNSNLGAKAWGSSRTKNPRSLHGELILPSFSRLVIQCKGTADEHDRSRSFLGRVRTFLVRKVVDNRTPG